MKKGTTNVYLLPNGDVMYDMGIWYRYLGPNGEDHGNERNLPKDAVQIVKAKKKRWREC